MKTFPAIAMDPGPHITVTAAQMQEMEKKFFGKGISDDTLMENAGVAIADAVSAQIGGPPERNILILVGPGKNGGDGLIAARHLALADAAVTVFLCSARPDVDTKLRLAEQAGVIVQTHKLGGWEEWLENAASVADALVDAILGIGSSRPIKAPLSNVLKVVAIGTKKGRTPVFAIDLPTGTDSDVGNCDANGLCADVTLMLGSPKIGPFLKPGFGTTGEIRVLDIGIPLSIQPVAAPRVLTLGEIKTFLPERPLASHKGTFGRLLVVAGSMNYVGAAHLTVKAASRSGVGLVTLASPTTVYKIVAPTLPESTYLPLPERKDGLLDPENAAMVVCSNLDGITSLVIGPGLGQNLVTGRFIQHMLRNLGSSTRLVLDADCLNILAKKKHWWRELPNQSIVTPHPGEMARLLGSSVKNVQDDRLAVARTAAELWGHIVVLKGPCTIVAHPDGRVSICPWINPGLAKAGSGDVLAGVIGGLLAQMPSMPMEAACLAVYVHGLAGEISRANIGEMGMTAGDLVRMLPSAYRKIVWETETNREMLQPTI